MRVIRTLVVTGMIVALTASCQTNSAVDGVPNSVAENAKSKFKSYLGLGAMKAFAYSPHRAKPYTHWYARWCHGQNSAEKAISCAVEECTNSKNKSRAEMAFPADCIPFALGDVVIDGKSAPEIAEISRRYNAEGRPGDIKAEKALPLKAAMAATVTFEKPKIEIPPRTIEDITAILDEQKLVDPEATSGRITALRKPAPKTRNNIHLAGFYLHRSVSAHALGHLQQAFDDIGLSAGYLKKVNKPGNVKLPSGKRLRKAAILKWQAKLEAEFGNYKKAKRLIHDHLRKIKNSKGYGGQAVALTDQLVESHIRTGNVKGAKKASASVRRILVKWSKKTGPNKKIKRQRLTAQILLAKWKGQILEMQGRWSDAEPHVRKVIDGTRMMAGLDKKRPHYIYQPYINLSTNLVKQGRLLEAENIARSALRGVLGVAGKYNLETIKFISALAEVLDAQGRFEDAGALHHAGLDIQTQLKVPAGSYFAEQRRFKLAKTRAALEDWPGAMTLFDQVRGNLGGTKKLFRKLTKDGVTYPLALIKTRRFDEAIKLLSPVLKKGDPRQALKRYHRAEKLAVLAMAFAGSDKTSEALRIYRRAIPILITDGDEPGQGTPIKTAKEKRLILILDDYINLISTIHESGDSSVNAAAEIFRVADVIRGRSVQTALAASGARMAAGRDDMAELARREQDAARQVSTLAEMLSHLLSSPAEQQDPEVTATLRNRINELRRARQTFLAEIKIKFPDYAALIKPETLSIENVQNLLSEKEVLVSFYITETHTFGWAIPKAGPIGFTKIKIGDGEIKDAAAHLRSALDPGQINKLSDIPEYDISGAYQLYKKLFKPLEANWKQASTILFVGDRALRQLPISMLPTKPSTLRSDQQLPFDRYRSVPWLARSHSVTVLPSVASLQVIRTSRRGGKSQRAFLGFGDPFFNKSQEIEAAQALALELASAGERLRNSPEARPESGAVIEHLPRLPDTRAEILSVANALGAVPERDIYLGTRANEGRVKSMNLKPYKVISFATHGLVSGDLDGLDQPALALSSPQVSGGPEDGLLTMEEILGLRLNADWVVLSACNTAAASGAGAEAISGLGRAFFYAGARALLVSNWPVHSGATTNLMQKLFTLQKNKTAGTRGDALRRARLYMVDEGTQKDRQGRDMFSYAHPIFWAPFIIVGDGGGAKPGS